MAVLSTKSLSMESFGDVSPSAPKLSVFLIFHALIILPLSIQFSHGKKKHSTS